MTKHAASEADPSIHLLFRKGNRSFVSLSPSPKSASDGRMQNLRARSVGRSGNRWEEYERGGEKVDARTAAFREMHDGWKAVHRPAASNAATASPSEDFLTK